MTLIIAVVMSTQAVAQETPQARIAGTINDYVWVGTGPEANEKGRPLLHARDKKTGQILASVELPIPGQYGMMTFMHNGKQYIVVQTGSAHREQPGALVALTLP